LKKIPHCLPWGTALKGRSADDTGKFLLFTGSSCADGAFSTRPQLRGNIRDILKWRIKSTGGHGVHLAVAGYFGGSSVPNQTPSIHTAPPFRATVIGVFSLPAVDELKSYSHRHPAFASFFAASALFLKIRISIHQDTPDRKFRGSKFESDAGIEKKGSFSVYSTIYSSLTVNMKLYIGILWVLSNKKSRAFTDPTFFNPEYPVLFLFRCSRFQPSIQPTSPFFTRSSFRYVRGVSIFPTVCS